MKRLTTTEIRAWQKVRVACSQACLPREGEPAELWRDVSIVLHRTLSAMELEASA